MKAKFIYEAIKHLSPKSDEDIRKQFDKMSPEEKIYNYKDMGINLSQAQLGDLAKEVNLPPSDKLKLYRYNDIEISDEERDKLLAQVADRNDRESFNRWDTTYHVYEKNNKPWVKNNILLPYIVMIAENKKDLLRSCSIFIGEDLTFDDIKIKFGNYF